AVHYRDSFMKEFLHQILHQHSKYNHRSLPARDAVLKLEMPIIFSQNHQTDVEEDLWLQLQPLHQHYDSRLDDYPLSDILLARQPLDPLMNVAHSLGPMNIVYSSLCL